MYKLHLLYSLVCWWTLRLLPYLPYLGCCNNAATNITARVSFQISVSIFTRCIPGSRIAGSCQFCFCFFCETSAHFSTGTAPLTFPPSVYEGFLFSTSSPTFVICGFFYDGHSNRYEVLSLWF